MFTYEEYYKLYNSACENEYREALAKLDDMLRGMGTPKEKGFREKVFWFLRTQAEFIQRLCLLEQKRTPQYLSQASLADLTEDQRLMYQDILPGSYENSYTNPAYAASVFGAELGPAIAAVAGVFREGIAHVDTHRRFCLLPLLRFYFALSYKMTHERVTVAGLSQVISKYKAETLETSIGLQLHERYSPQSGGELERVLTGEGPYSLYSAGVYADDNALELWKFTEALPEEKITTMARALVNAYKESFYRERKDIRKKKSVGICYPLGMERLVKAAVPVFKEEIGFVPFVEAALAVSPNRQYKYDHRYDWAMYLNAESVENYLAAYAKALEDNRAMLSAYGGVEVIDFFGDGTFSPEMKKILEPTEEQNALYSKLMNETERMLENVMGAGTTVFSMVSYPSPMIGEHFGEIFDEMIEINTMDKTHTEKAQNSLINALDKGQSVFIKGRGGNETILTVALWPIENPYRHTNFYNCLADFNVPMGEVYTTPQLAGTTGLLHVEDAYLDGFYFKNLKLWFEDGYVTDYKCDNFETAEEGRKYIEDTLLHPYKTLPMGEFAIGTNTRAYVMADRYQIWDKLPVLISEKCGPHFAIGDTCFAYAEDQSVYNADRKEIKARENEKTALRKDNPEEAYTGIHIDIVLPYDSIERITVNTGRGTTDLIRAGLFVLPGTDLLNEPLFKRQAENEAVKSQNEE